jgi:hypothetical protein
MVFRAGSLVRFFLASFFSFFFLSVFLVSFLRFSGLGSQLFCISKISTFASLNIFGFELFSNLNDSKPKFSKKSKMF